MLSFAAFVIIGASSCGGGGGEREDRVPPDETRRIAHPDSAAPDSIGRRSGYAKAMRRRPSEAGAPASKHPSGAGGEANGSIPRPGGDAVAVPVEVARISRREMTDYILASTTLEAMRHIEIFAKTSGIVRSLYVEEGDQVSSGDTLVILDDREARLNLRRREIAYREALNALNRSREMSAKSLISREEFETTELAYESAKTDLEEAKLQLEYTRVTAPIGGAITSRMVELGSMVMQGTVLFNLADFNPLRARIYIPEKDIRRLKIGQTALLAIDSEPGRTFPAEVELISSVIDPSSGTFKVTVSVKSSSGRLRPGMFASAKIVVDSHKEALAVPTQAILYEGDSRYIYVVKDGAARRVDVETGFAEGGYVELRGQVTLGDLVVVAGQNNLADGSTVDVVKDNSGDTGSPSGTGKKLPPRGQGD
jgi:membrane fusion protein (multidrug efflux system)